MENAERATHDNVDDHKMKVTYIRCSSALCIQEPSDKCTLRGVIKRCYQNGTTEKSIDRSSERNIEYQNGTSEDNDPLMICMTALSWLLQRSQNPMRKGASA